MSVSPLHLLSQGPVVTSILRAGYKALTRPRSDVTPPPPTAPGPELTEIVQPRPAGLVRDYVHHVGGDPSAYRGLVPFHLFPQWTFPIMSRVLEDLPYDLTKVLNAGCAVWVREQLPAGRPLKLSARLERADVNERRALLTVRLLTGPEETPDALKVELTVIVKLSRPDRSKSGPKKAPPTVPPGSREVGRFRVHQRSGLEFALLTGDFNPIHWIAPAARAFGHPGPILHGFATMARCVEALNKTLWAGDLRTLSHLDVRFGRPLSLPGRVGVYVDGSGGVYAGDAPGAPAYLTGSYAETERRS